MLELLKVNPNRPMGIQTVLPGSYHHFGNIKGIKYLSNYVPFNDELLSLRLCL